MVRLTDHPDMTLDVYHGRKTTIQQQQVEDEGHNERLNNEIRLKVKVTLGR